MYETYFNLHVKPFELVPDPRFIFLSKSHKKALSFLNYGIQERSGFILLTGEVGSGKTTLIRGLINRKYERLVLAKIFNTCVTSAQLLAMINDDFGLPVQGKDKVALIRDLNGFLVEQYACGNQPVLIIDEAQNLGTDLLEEIRMLPNLDTDASKLLHIMLVGHRELRTILAAPGLLQLRQRISINCHIQALNRQETEQYIEHRLDVAGNVKAVVFPPETLDYIYQYSRGIPRLINIICDFLMLSAFAEETSTISVDMVSEIIGDLDFENHYWSNAVAGKKNGEFADCGNSAGDEPQGSFSRESHDFLQDISRRIESIEKHVAPVNSSIIVHLDQLATQQNARKPDTDKSDAHAAYINKRSDSTMLSGSATTAQTSPVDPASKGIIQRVFSSSYSKKVQ